MFQRESLSFNALPSWCLLVFPIFGAASTSTVALPLLFILIPTTTIKDGVEDYRHAKLDEEVNTSATTCLGQRRNVSQPLDPRPWYERLLRIKAFSKPSKEKVAGEGTDQAKQRLRWKQSQHEHDGPNEHPQPWQVHRREASRGHCLSPAIEIGSWGQNTSLSAYQESIPSRSSFGDIDWKWRTGGTARWERTLWKKLGVGGVVLRENEQVPADIIVLSTSDPDGICYLETKNLDGETHLGPREALHATSSIASEEDVEKSSFILESEPPHQNLYLCVTVRREICKFIFPSQIK